MNEIQVSNYMKLGLAKLSAGNLPEAENYFQEILKNCNYGPAWLGLGDATLAGLYKEHNHENINQVVNNAFYFYGQSKFANPDEAEKIEIKILDTSLMYITKFCNDIKVQHDEKQTIDNNFKRMLLPAIIASTGSKERSAAIGGNLQKLLSEGKSLENNIGYTVVAMTKQ